MNRKHFINLLDANKQSVLIGETNGGSSLPKADAEKLLGLHSFFFDVPLIVEVSLMSKPTASNAGITVLSAAGVLCMKALSGSWYG